MRVHKRINAHIQTAYLNTDTQHHIYVNSFIQPNERRRSAQASVRSDPGGALDLTELRLTAPCVLRHTPNALSPASAKSRKMEEDRDPLTSRLVTGK